MCDPLRILSKRGITSFYFLVRNSHVMSEQSTRSQPVFLALSHPCEAPIIIAQPVRPYTSNSRTAERIFLKFSI
jgi:hypothetical protein